MAKINLIHDYIGKTLTIHFNNPETEHASELSDDEIIVMKDSSGKIVGLEILHFDSNPDPDDTVDLKIIA